MDMLPTRRLSIWSLENRRSAAEALKHVPRPADLVQQIENDWKDDLGG